ncbi:MAG: PfkB family carbohydrate kinase [Vicinamibacterales bacterium]
MWESYRAVAERVDQEFDMAHIAITLRESRSASENGWSAVLIDAADRQFYKRQQYDITVVDRLGGGDSLTAGLIYGLLEGRTAEASLRFAVAASALKHSIPGAFIVNRTGIVGGRVS